LTYPIVFWTFTMTKNHLFYKKIGIVFLLIASTLALYWQVSGFDFVGYDDSLYISLASKDLSLSSIAWAFSTLEFANWHPLTWLSLILDYNLFGSDPSGYHITNLIFHMTNTILLFLCLHAMTGSLYRSAFVAALFALHPLHVESVAWVSERKDVLSALFWILTMWAYVSYTRKPGILKYATVFALFAIGLTAKPMLVTLPFVLLLLDYWPLARIRNGYVVPANILPMEKKSIPFLLLEKVPLLALTLSSSIVTYIAQNKYHAVASLQHASIMHRVLNAFNSYVAYLGKTIWFQDLSAFYPYPKSIGIVGGGSSILLIFSMTLLIASLAKTAPYLATGWFWFLGTLVPVIGIIQVGSRAMADRYTYIPLIGIFIAISWGLNHVLERRPYRKPLAAFAAVFFLSVCSVAAYHQASTWTNTFTLFKNALDLNWSDYRAYNIIGVATEKNGDHERALYYFQMALKTNPQYDPAYVNAGNTLRKMGRIDNAIHCYRKALQINQKSADAEYNLGIILMEKNLPEEAIHHLKKSIEIKPNDADAHNNLGIAFMKTGNIKKALFHFTEAQRLNPKSLEASNNLAIAHRRMNDDIRHNPH